MTSKRLLTKHEIQAMARYQGVKPQYTVLPVLYLTVTWWVTF